jgi:protein-disulfide isomerase
MNDQEATLTKKERKAAKRQQKLIEKARQEREQKRNKLFTYLGSILILVGVGYFIYNRQVPIPPGDSGKPSDAVHQADWIKGPSKAPVVLVEYSDFQCPACRSYVPVVQELTEQFGDNLVVVYRHFPLKQIHLQAELAAQAAEAAGKQGKFWEMHDLLFDRQQDWSENRKAGSLFGEYATEIGLEINQFQSDLKSKEVKGLVKADFQDGLGLGISSTPTFYINGEQITNPRSVEEFAALIETQLPATRSAEIDVPTTYE